MSQSVAAPQGPTAAILSFLAQARGIDLHDYRQEVIESRLAARLEALGCANHADYLRRLARQPDEVDRLVDALLVNVTGFFRDPAVFDFLRREAIPRLLQTTPRLLRAWVVGTATGEEAYSLAMLLAEAGDRRPGLGWEVLGTDLNAGALATAQAGWYSAEAVTALPPDVAGRFLEPADGGWMVAAPLRSRVRFARHDLLGRRLAPPEAVVASFNLILCRNVLIYFDRRLQEKAFSRLAATLAPGGLLVLGLAESVPDHLRQQLAALDERLRVYTWRDGT